MRALSLCLLGCAFFMTALHVNAAGLNIHSMQEAIEIYENEDGDVKAALDYFMLKALEGDAEAMYYLANAYSEGKGVKKNLDECRSWLEKSGQNGYSNAYTLLGVMYAYGEFGKEDAASAVKYYQKAADAGEPEAMVYLGQDYLKGWGGLPKDEKLGMQWLNKSCALDFSEACDLAEMYKNK